MKKGIIKTVAVILAASVFALFSCTNKKADSSVRKIVAGTGGNHAPFEFKNEKGELTGFEVELVREIFKKLPQYEVSFVVAESQSTLTGLDAGLYQISFNQWGYNKNRGTKYIISDVQGVLPHAIAVRKDNKEIKSVFDLPGHNVYTKPGNANDNIYRRWNERHPDKKINVGYREDLGNALVDVENGVIDFYYHSKASLVQLIDSLKLKDIKLIDVSLPDNHEFTQGIEGSFFYFPIGEEKLRDDFNAAFEELLADGTVEKLFHQFFPGYDFLNSLDYVKEARAFIEADLAKK